MKIEFLLDEGSRFEKQTLMWHGTKVENIRSILKHGLLANKKDVSPWKTHGLNVPSKPFGYDDAGESYTGVYLTEDVQYALNSSHGWPDVILIAVMTRKSGLAIDEDNVYMKIENILHNIFNYVYENKFLSLSSKDVDENEIHSLILSEFNRQFRISDRIEKTKQDALKELQSYEPLLKELTNISHGGAKEFANMSPEQKAEVRLKVRRIYDKITLKLGRIKDDHINEIKAYRHLGDIKFSGASKIISIYIYDKKTDDVTIIFETDLSMAQANNDIIKLSERRKATKPKWQW